MRELLTLHCPLQETGESLHRERFLVERLLVPERWIHEAKATRARRDGDRQQEALHLYRAGYWNQCHRLLIQHLASGTSNWFKLGCRKTHEEWFTGMLAYSVSLLHVANVSFYH